MSSNSPQVQKPAPPRKKACALCTQSKVRCSLERPSCSRCWARGRGCQYPGERPILSHSGPNITRRERTANSSLNRESLPDFSIGTSQSPNHALQTQATDSSLVLDFDHLDLVPMEDSEKIRDRWLQPYFLDEGQVPKLFNPFTVQFLTCVLRSYPNHFLEKSLPPFIHPLQLEASPRSLAICYSFVPLWMNRISGSEFIVLSTIRPEMERIAHENPTGDLDILCSLQAYLVYLMTAYFYPIYHADHASLVDDMSMITLQELAFRAAKPGFTCRAELSGTRPTWESWVIASAKRRTLFAMYLFTSLYNSDKGRPNFLSDELRDMLVPESKALWEASERKSWEREYNRHLLKWEDGMLRISELWKSEETGSEARRNRITRWVQSTDEFGMMLFTVCAHIHGC